MNISSILLVALMSAFAVGSAMAEGVNAAAQPKAIQVAVVNPETPVMTHQIATLMQMKQQADAQYRRSGSAADQAYAQALRAELASRGFGRMTTPAPALNPAGLALASAAK